MLLLQTTVPFYVSVHVDQRIACTNQGAFFKWCVLEIGFPESKKFYYLHCLVIKAEFSERTNIARFMQSCERVSACVIEV